MITGTQMAWAVVALLVVGVLLVFRKPLGRLIHLGFRTCGGLAFLAVLQQIGGIAGVSLGVNVFNAVILAILGVPGFGLLMMLCWMMR